jgi:UDP-N-acetylglucosamine 2-epimerase (non-hydrolysing)
MPEEINRILTDQLADLLFTTEASAGDNLLREGIPATRIRFVGNVMIDSLLRHRARATQLDVIGPLGLRSREYALVTLHRPANVDSAATVAGLLDVLADLQAAVPVVFPVHPRTRARIQEFGLADRLAAMSRVRLTDPLGYLEFLNLMANARLVLTDSGGVQEETTILGVPCVTARDNTERPVTITHGTNTLAGTDPERIRAAVRHVLQTPSLQRGPPDLWDGHAADRIASILLDRAS